MLDKSEHGVLKLDKILEAVCPMSQLKQTFLLELSRQLQVFMELTCVRKGCSWIDTLGGIPMPDAQSVLSSL